MWFARRRFASILVLAAALGLPAAASALTCDWTGAASVGWNDPANWSNCGGGIPGAADTAVITNVPRQPVVGPGAMSVGGLTLGSGTNLTIASVGNLTLNGPVVGAGNITVAGILTWLSGEMSGTGVTTIQPFGGLSLLDTGSKVLSRNLINSFEAATFMSGGDSSLIITAGAVFTNAGNFTIHNGSVITGAGEFQNLPNSIFWKAVSSSTLSVSTAVWLNHGEVHVLNGTLSISSATATHGGSYNFNTRLSFPTGTHTVLGSIGGSNLEMNTQVDFAPGSALTNNAMNVEIRGNVTFNTGQPLTFGSSLLLEGGTISGGDSITTNNFQWLSGTLTGTGTMTVQGILNLEGPGVRTLDRDLTNQVTATMALAPGTLVIPSNRTFTNAQTATFQIANDSAILGEGVFENLGQFHRTTSTGTATVDLDFRNAGTVLLESGTTVFHEYLQTAGTTDLAGGDLGVVHELFELEGGLIKGIGDIFASVVATGTAAVTPGDSEGTITIQGDYRQSTPAVYHAELGSPASDRIAVLGQARLGGNLDMTVTAPPVPNFDYVLLSYASRVGKFGFPAISGPPPAGLSWTLRYGATEFSLRAQALLPNDPLLVDSLGVPGGISNHNSVLEPGEIVTVAPTWLNPTAGPSTVTGTASSFTGPSGATYDIVDSNADYGTIGASLNGSCDEVGTEDCYSVAVDDPLVRPALHWDATFDEALTGASEATYTVHVGDSFGDVPPAHPFYLFIETLLHNEVTAGCGGSNYCPDSAVTRAQMAVFLLVSRFGVSYLPPEASGTVFSDLPPGSFAAAFIEDLAARGVTAGCGDGNFCPFNPATREQMAVFLLRTLEGPTYVPPDCTEPPTFTDVPCSSPFAKWIEELALRGITAGCGPPGLYCPGNPHTRGEMAVFLSVTFGLRLNGA